MTRDKFQELEGIKLMPHPVYSPNLAPLDYYLFPNFVYFLLNALTTKVEASEKEFFASIDKSWYQHGMKELVASDCTMW